MVLVPILFAIEANPILVERGSTRNNIFPVWIPFLAKSEEDVELEKSTKKANTVEQIRGETSPVGWSVGEKGRQSSYKDKLTGSIPGAYAQVFDFAVNLEANADSDDDMPKLVEGRVAAKFSKTTKLRIRKRWVNTLIIKDKTYI
nr:hypothetical protein CFP56_36761 [Quercus suber]